MSHSRLTKWALTRGRFQPAESGKMQPIARAISHCFTAQKPGAFQQLRDENVIPEIVSGINGLLKSAHEEIERRNVIVLKGRSCGKTWVTKEQFRRLQQHGYRLGNFPDSPVTVGDFATRRAAVVDHTETASARARMDKLASWVGVDLASGPDQTVIAQVATTRNWWKNYFAKQLEGQDHPPAYMRDMIDRIDRFNPEHHILVTTPMRRDNSAASWRAYMRAFGLGDFAAKRDWMRQFRFIDGEIIEPEPMDLTPHLMRSSELWSVPIRSDRDVAINFQTPAPTTRTMTV